jgi:triphosphoribosyl-dephospho-CoA synthase
LQAAAIGDAAERACVLEATAPKPGNVSPGRPFADVRYEDFLASAAAIRLPVATVDTRSVGETVFLAVEATARVARANTNLGMILLLAPIAHAAVRIGSDLAQSDDRVTTLRTELNRVLAQTTVDDALHVFRAIRLVNPGGLGRADDQDVWAEPTVTLLEAMRLAADRDGIAREYATACAMTFETGAPALSKARADGLSWNDAIVETFLTVLEAAPDTHIVRRGGEVLAKRASRLAQDALAAGGVRTEAGRRAIAGMDAVLRDPDNLGNPGTTADLTAAAIFVTLLVGREDDPYQEQS